MSVDSVNGQTGMVCLTAGDIPGVASQADLAAPAGAALVGFLQAGSAAVPRTSLDKARETISVFDFGAIGDGVCDDTAAFQGAVDYLFAHRISRTSGTGRIYLGRGEFVVNGTISIPSAIGLEFVGESRTSSVITRTNDTGDLFFATVYSALQFSNLSILHVSEATRDAWTTVCFALNGTGGGQGLQLDNIRTLGFNRVIDFRAVSQNEDTTYAVACQFTDFKTFLYSRNSQALINKFTQCTWFGTVNEIFNISGYGHTHLDTANVVTSGTLFALAEGVQGPQSQYICTNVKMEYWPQTGNAGTTKIITMAGAAYAQFKFVGGGLAGSTPDPSIFQIDLRPLFTKVVFEGGSWDEQIKIRSTNAASTSTNPQTNNLVLFDGCLTSPLPSNVTFSLGGPAVSWCPVVWRDCANRVNLCMTGSGSAAASVGINSAVSGDYTRNRNTSTGFQFMSGVLAGTSTTHAFPHYGQRAFVKSIQVGIIDQGAVVAGNIKAYADAAKTQLIGTVAMTAGVSTVPKLYAVPIPDSYLITDGVYVELSNTSSVVARGRVYIETESV